MLVVVLLSPIRMTPKTNYAVPDLNEIQNSIIGYLPQGVLMPKLDELNINDTINKVTDILKKKCLEVSGNDTAYDEASNAATKFSECIQNTVDISNIGEEIKQAKPTGDLDIVFEKYCSKRDKALNCLEAFSNATNPCLTNDEISHKRTTIGMIRRLLEFVCHHNGNQIALFIAEQGPECIESNERQLVTCFNQTYGKFITNELPAIEDVKFTISRENCVDLKKFEDCVVGELEKCEESTPANLAEALFRYVKRETICKDQNIMSSASSVYLSIILLVMSIFLNFS
ncbi:27 kDa glycoprotein-like [Chironomus tepperi]|uniref:27 kDa glycoprotein-like n=1 Tax=Chironomus tepperi TaxID=113505 RepID=UPI00391FB61F